MEQKMIRLVLRSVAVMLLLTFAVIAAASDVHCPVHEEASCYYTGQVKWDDRAHMWKKYHCSCNDDVWVKED